MRNRTQAIFGAFILTCGLSAASRAEAPNYTEFFRLNVLKCIHATANIDKATVEILKPAETSGEITTVRLKAYYDGLIKKNNLEADLMVRQAGSIRQMKIKVLSDTGTTLAGCELEKTWKDF